MKKPDFRKVVISFVVFFLIIAFLVPTVLAISVYAAGNSFMGSYERDALEEADYNALKTQLLIEQELSRWAEERRKAAEEQAKVEIGKEESEDGKGDEDDSGDGKDDNEDGKKEDLKKKKIDKTVEVMKLVNQKVPEIVSFIKDIENGGDFDTAALMTNIFSTASGVANCIPPWGPIVGAAIDIVGSVFMAIMGGEEPPSATALLEDSMNQRFDEISNQIFGLENQIGDLSDQINDSTNKIIEEMTVALEVAEAQETLKEFYLSTGKGDFSYNQYRNYIYGATKNNSSATTAYYNLLLHAQFEGASEEEIKYYYDALYDSLADYRDIVRDYIVGNQTGKSIVQCYYDVLASNPKYAAETGLTAELAAIQFAYDLYQTQIMADEIMLVCNNYQYIQMLLNESSTYRYGTETDDVVTQSQIEGDDDLDSVYTQALLREEELVEQFAKDIAYVLNTNRTYTMEAEDETLYVLKTEEENGVVYGKVPLNSKVYLNRIPDSVCELFDISSEDYVYEGDGILDKDGIFKMNSSQSVVYLTYKGTPVSTICFVDASASKFSGGSGTVDDPYLISTADQFRQINDGMDKYYRLISNIDFENAEKYPLGRVSLGEDSFEYEEFNGILDGNGHTISNLTIKGDDYAGVFGKIGERGVVKNLSLNNVRVQTTGNAIAKSSTYTFYAGFIAGDNCGTIRNCYITSSNYDKSSVQITTETTNEGAERSIYFYVGGIAGRNRGLIQFVSVSRSNVAVDSTHNFNGAATSTNKNMAYVGGVCGYNYGYIKCAIVDESVRVNSKVESIYDAKTTVNPYVTSLAGGITGKNYDESLSDIQNVYSTAQTIGTAIIECESGWGEHYANVVGEANAYVPKSTQEKIDKICASSADIQATFHEKGALDVTFEDITPVYNVGDETLNFENITLEVNGSPVEYEVLALYGFDTTRGSEKQYVTMLFVAYIGESRCLMYTEFEVAVADYVLYITVDDMKTEYGYGDALPTTVTVIQHYASGAAIPVYGVNFDVADKDNITKKYGTHDITFAYEDLECEISVRVVCPHESSYDFSNDKLYEHVQTVEPTCMSIGYDEYKCLECSAIVKTKYKSVTNHKLIEEISVEATCYSKGVAGRVYCEFCEETFAESADIPMMPHSIVKVTDTSSSYKPNSTNHYCENGKHWISHNYVASENYENDGILYTYTCKDCGYVSEEKDTNFITNSERKQPVVVVSDGYALTSDDLVTIYVQLVNNPGVCGADFGIQYDERLTLVSWSDGMLFEKIFNQTDGIGKFEDSASPKSCGYNFVWGIEKARDPQGNLICPDGNLLKLVFKLPEDAKDTDKFVVSVVYSSVDDLKAGFTVDSKVCNEQNISAISPQTFLTKDGVIQIVEHLPGDVNSDNSVDILDVLYLANYLANRNYEKLGEIKAYGDVNLSGGYPNNTDALIILRSLTGGYGDDGNPLYSKYQVSLNTNGYSDLVLDPVFVDLYGENNKYSYILDPFDVDMQKREGYKFLGWYTRIMCSCKESNCTHIVKCACEEARCKHASKTIPIAYDHDQKIQVLYARWEKNSVTFKDSESNDYELDYLANGVLLAPSESCIVTFYKPYDKQINDVGYLVHEFDYWLGNDGNKYYEGQSVDMADSEIGKLVLTAVWKGWILDAPKLSTIGYDPNEIEWYLDEGTNQSIEYYGYEKFAKKDVKELYAKWTSPLVYSIEYQLEEGSFGAAHPNTAKYDEFFTISNPVRVGYTFTGWTITGMDKEEHFYWNGGDAAVVSNNKTIWNDIKATEFKNLHSNSGTVKFTANWVENTYYIEYVLDGGTLGYYCPQKVTYDSAFSIDHPTRIGHTFGGWIVTGMDNTEHFYWDSTNEVFVSSNESTWENMKAVGFKNLHSGSGIVTFTATWVRNQYTVMYNGNKPNNASHDVVGVPNNSVTWIYSDRENHVVAPDPSLTGWKFQGWYSSTGEKIENGAELTTEPNDSVILYAHWEPITYYVFIDIYDMNNEFEVKYDETYTLSWDNDWKNSFADTIKFDGWYYCGEGTSWEDESRGNPTRLLTTESDYTIKNWTTVEGMHVFFYGETHHEDHCVTGDTMITLADGKQVRVDSLTGEELLLVWNMAEGRLDYAPIMFVDSDPLSEYEVITLLFEDGTSVNVISEHGFWDYDLNRYVYLDENASDYIGHYFAKHNGDKLERVQLIGVDISVDSVTPWSPVTAEHLCYFVNGMLSMPGGAQGMFNIFEVDPNTMMYDYASIEQDIEKYGLFTYEELNAIAPLSETMFEICGGAYLKISLGKGNMTLDDLIYMITRYGKYFE